MFNERLDVQQATALLSITSEQTRQMADHTDANSCVDGPPSGAI